MNLRDKDLLRLYPVIQASTVRRGRKRGRQAETSALALAGSRARPGRRCPGRSSRSSGTSTHFTGETTGPESPAASGPKSSFRLRHRPVRAHSSSPATGPRLPSRDPGSAPPLRAELVRVKGSEARQADGCKSSGSCVLFRGNSLEPVTHLSYGKAITFKGSVLSLNL